MNFKKTMVAGAMAAGLGLGASAANAVLLDIVDWHLEDYDSDGLSSDFLFFGPPSGSSGNQFASGTGDGDTFLTDGATTYAPGVISTGFNFDGTGIFSPRILTGGIDGTLCTDCLDITFSVLNLGGNFPFTGGNTGNLFDLPPDDLAAVIAPVEQLGPNKWGVVATYIGTINDTNSSFNNFPANWRLEGVVTTVPVPAAAWLFGSGLVGLVGIARRRNKRS